MDQLEVKLKIARSQTQRPSPLGAGEINQRSVEHVLRVECAKDSFVPVEDYTRELARGTQWRRRRVGWVDPESKEDRGLCVNEIRIEKMAGAEIHPGVAMTYPGLEDFEAVEHAYWQTVWAGGALRLDRGQKESRLFVNMRELTCAKQGAPRGPWEDLQSIQKRVESGEDPNTLKDLIPLMRPTWRPVEETSSDVARYLPAFPPSWGVQADGDVLASTNAGYFVNFPEEYDDGVSALHQPLGGLYSDDKLHMPPWIERPCAIEWKDGSRRIEMLGPQNLALVVDGQDAVPLIPGIYDSRNDATIWRSFDGELPEANDAVLSVDLVFSGAGLVGAYPCGTQQPPIGGAIVRLEGVLAQPWLEWMKEPKGTRIPKWELVLLTSRDLPILWVIAAGPKLLLDGKVLEEEQIFSPLACGEFHADGPPPTRFPYDATKTRAPRTAIGLTRREEWVLLVVDGRADPSHSVGCTLEELSRLMHEVGCYSALNLDGGGSSVMVVEGVTELDQLKPGLTKMIVNIPSDPGHRERIVPVALNVVRNSDY